MNIKKVTDKLLTESAYVKEGVRQFSPHVKKWETMLKKTLGRGFKAFKTFVKKDDKTFYMNFFAKGKQGESSSDLPFFHLLIQYSVGKDLYKLIGELYTGSGKLLFRKEFDDVYAEDFSDPDKYLYSFKKFAKDIA